MRTTKQTTFVQQSFENLDLRIYFNKEIDLFKCIIRDGDQRYESEAFPLQSNYQEGILQDCLGEIGTAKFFNTFGTIAHREIKKALLGLLDQTTLPGS